MQPRRGLSLQGRAKPVLCHPPKKSCLGGGQAVRMMWPYFTKESVYLRGEVPRAFPGGPGFAFLSWPSSLLDCAWKLCVCSCTWFYRHKTTPDFFVHFLIYGGNTRVAVAWQLLKLMWRLGRGSVCVGIETPSPCSCCSHLLGEANPSLGSWGS